ncbi:MAG: hypothetical protein Q4A71_01175 [Actinomycetaceae bacterium]|nr:hypothetical protein [Actinomycetaceae bacterium]
MAQSSLKTIEAHVESLAGRRHYDREFLFDLLVAYGKSKNYVRRLRMRMKVGPDVEDCEVAYPNVVYFREVDADADLLAQLQHLRVAARVTRVSPRFVMELIM